MDAIFGRRSAGRGSSAATFVLTSVAVALCGCQERAGTKAAVTHHEETATAAPSVAPEPSAALPAAPVPSSAPPGSVELHPPAVASEGEARPRAVAPARSATPVASAVTAIVSASAAPPAAPPPEPPPTRSAEQNEASFRLWAQSSGRYHAGTPGHFDVVLVPSGDYHCNPNYPYKLTLGAAPAGVTFPSAVLRSEAMSIAEKRTVVNVPFVPSVAGAATLTGRFSLSVCTSQVCHTETRDVALPITVE